ncbi:hypothetical protein SERLADRAFT_433068 [Serpula lacrymans var. lacrymans S7.9]|uniref:Uncharacterized protein n=1 Tax=Serpula lacrymans var. lacrymans (strain S7.9) TaxID=578457 RepID=F8NGC1_SERL9|nr:uncharacterized protein SERLADRAFT_433068 [Serpula lacrymans var. lacrymans S7.9]EGO29056.1 hypothetical protein SERLADRAFT_433068 [Serpula lacrymans var. lacrymans S7.9]
MTSQKLTLKISSMKNRLLANKENQPSSQQSQSPAPKEPRNAKWTSEDDATLVDKLKEAQMEGNQPDNNFKKPAFVAAAVVLVHQRHLQIVADIGEHKWIKMSTADGHPESDLDLDGEEKSQDSIEVSQSSKRKCAASGSPTPTSAASSLSCPDPSISQLIGDVPSTPKRRIAAIKAVCVDNALATAKRTQAIALFTKNIAIADAYSAISDDVL